MTNPIFHGGTKTSTPRDLLDRERCAKFSAWVDAQLEILEQKFAEYVTPQSAQAADQFDRSKNRGVST